MERHRFRIACALVVLVCLFLSRDEAIAVDVSGDSSYFPLRIGNQWTFVSSGGRSITERILDTVRVDGDLYFRFDSVQSQTHVLYRRVGQKVYRFLDTSAVLWYDFSADSGATWTIPGAELEVTVTSTRDTVRVPAGFFAGCYRLYFFLGADAAWTEWFARGVGIVKRELITIAGATGWTLSHSIVADVNHVPRPEQRQDFALEQNYPNPFNPTTSIRFTAAVSSPAVLQIFDILGCAIETLLDEEVTPGIHVVIWDAKDQPSGVYVCRLQFANASSTRRLVLIR